MSPHVTTFFPDTRTLEVPCSEMVYDLLRPGATIRLRCRFLQAGVVVHRRKEIYDHPAPPFSRIFLMKRGKAELCTPEGACTLLPNVIYLLPDHQPFTVAYFPGTLYYFHVHMIDHTGLSVFSGCRGVNNLDDKGLFDAVVASFDGSTNPSLETLLMHVGIRFCAHMFERLERRVMRGEKYAELLRHIQDSKIPMLSVQQLADRMHMSRSVLSKDFKRRIGASLKTYLQNVNHQKATDLLAHSDLTILQIADELGYDEPTYFHRVFKKRTGVSPRVYRMRMRGLEA